MTVARPEWSNFAVLSKGVTQSIRSRNVPRSGDRCRVQYQCDSAANYSNYFSALRNSWSTLVSQPWRTDLRPDFSLASAPFAFQIHPRAKRFIPLGAFFRSFIVFFVETWDSRNDSNSKSLPRYVRFYGISRAKHARFIGIIPLRWFLDLHPAVFTRPLQTWPYRNRSTRDGRRTEPASNSIIKRFIRFFVTLREKFVHPRLRENHIAINECCNQQLESAKQKVCVI